MQKLAFYKMEMANLGLSHYILYKLQQVRWRCFNVNHPVSLRSRYAAFPLKCRPNTSDRAVFFHIFVEREYECLDDLPDAKLIIDCGAYVGYSSAYFLSRFPNSHVIAVEPDPDNFEILQANLKPYKRRYRAIRSAVWSRPKELALSKQFRDGREWSRSVKEVVDGEKSTLLATDIGTLLRDSGYDRISILKIDIEGAEATVFSFNYENWITKVDNIVIELHSEECACLFRKAISSEDFSISHCGELTVCKRTSIGPIELRRDQIAHRPFN
jgi:FkbM family methyltransferase